MNRRAQKRFSRVLESLQGGWSLEDLSLSPILRFAGARGSGGCGYECQPSKQDQGGKHGSVFQKYSNAGGYDYNVTCQETKLHILVYSATSLIRDTGHLDVRKWELLIP